MAKGSVNGSQTTQEGEITPEERSRVEASIRGLEQAPSTRQQLGAFTNWKQVQDQLGEPFNNERIPLKKLKLMRRDPMFGFGLHYQRMPLVKAPWFMKCLNPQVAGFMDAAIRAVWASYVIAHTQKLEFGFQAIAKRFALAAPQGTYIDPESGEEKPVWDQTGGILPVSLKKPVALPPESVEPIFDEKTGEFAGINYTPPSGGAPAGVGAKAKKKGPGGSEGGVEIDLYHSMWVTNEIESVFGNLFGYPRLGYGYPYWWSYWFRWAQADRAFEKKGDPPIVVRHPSGKIDLGDGTEMSANEYAMLMGEQVRSGAAIALPSDVYMGIEDKPSGIREWDIEFMKDGVQLDPYDESFDYLDVMKLRSIFVPEQALIEGGGGTSSRNVAEEMFEGLVKGQTYLMEEIVESINRWVIPHLMMVNFPKEFDEGLRCELTVQGFSSTDMELLSQIVQLIGQSKPELMGIDVREALRQLNMPLLPNEEYQKQLAAAAAAASAPPEVSPTSSQSGVVPTKGRAPSTGENTPGSERVGQGGSFTGFAYVPPQGLAIQFSAIADAASSFISDLPPSPHYEDKVMKTLTKRLWRTMQGFYSSLYAEFAEHVEGLDKIQLSEEEEEQFIAEFFDADDDNKEIDFAIPEIAREIGRRIVGNWATDIDKLDQTMGAVTDVLERMLKRAASLSRKNAGLAKTVTDEDARDWVSSHVTDLMTKAVETVRGELSDFVGKKFNDEEGIIAPEDLSKQVRAHFSDFPQTKANLFARTEARDAFNAGTLLTGQANGLVAAQAIDALGGATDATCEHRDGQIFPIDRALRENEHPNGTLGWRLLKEPVTLARVDDVPGEIPGTLASYDAESKTIYLSREIEPDDESKYLMALGEKLS